MDSYSSTTTVPLVLPNGTKIRVEVTDLNRSGETDVAFLEDVEEALAIDGIRGAIEGIGQMVTGALKTLAPRKTTMEFALEVGLESGKLTALWVKGSGKANLKITLEWSGESSGNTKSAGQA